MQKAPPEVAVAILSFVALSVLAVVLIYLSPKSWTGVRDFRERLLAQWKPALAIALVYAVSSVIGSWPDPGRLFGVVIVGPMIFSQSLLGLAIARSIAGFEPLPVARAVMERRRPWRAVALFLLIAIVAGVVGLFIGSVGMSVARGISGEISRSEEAASAIPGNKGQIFFLLLAGAGIAEETTYRLLAVSLVWWLTGRRWLSIVVGAVLFGAYHLSPLDSMYLIFWQFPVSQFIASAFIGILWGYLYTRRGYEAAVLGHTMGDWIGVLFFT